MPLQPKDTRRDEERATSQDQKDDRSRSRVVPSKFLRHLIPDHHGGDKVAGPSEERRRDEKAKRHDEDEGKAA